MQTALTTMACLPARQLQLDKQILLSCVLMVMALIGCQEHVFAWGFATSFNSTNKLCKSSPVWTLRQQCQCMYHSVNTQGI